MKKIIGILLFFFVFTSSVQAEGYNFSKTEKIRDDGRISALCVWEYPDQKRTVNVTLGTCFEDNIMIGDSGMRYEDGSAPYEHKEFVGSRNSNKSITGLMEKRVIERVKKENERINKQREDRQEQKIEKKKLEIKRLTEQLELLYNQAINLTK